MSNISLAKYISHAGGAIKNVVYSNSLEALNHSYKLGHKFIEIDISQTNDNKFILLHDFYKTRMQLFGKKGIISEKYFLKSKMVKNLTSLNLNMMLEWLISHPDVFLLTDVKNIKISTILKYIETHYPQAKKQIIPQIYFFSEYDAVQKLGYDNIILALYKLKNSNQEILKFIATHQLLAISIDRKRTLKGLALQIKNINPNIILHTVNETSEINHFHKLGIRHFFTDSLI